MGLVLAGADPIVVVDRMPAKLDLAIALGATHGILAGPDPDATRKEIRGGDERRSGSRVRGDRPADDDRAGDRLPAAGRHGRRWSA